MTLSRQVMELLLKSLVALLLLLALVLVRLPSILDLPAVKLWIDGAWIGSGVIGLVILLYYRPLFGLLSAALFTAILWHSYTRLYHPSLAPGIPRLDYLFFDRVSANFCFDLAKTYSSNFAPAFLVFSAFFAANKHDLNASFHWISKLLLWILLLNLFVIGWQGFWNIEFLASGSGTAVSARRAPGLLEDSGASTITISSLLIFFVITLFESIMNLRKKYLLLGGWFALAGLGCFTGGRSYLSLLALGIMTYGASQLYKTPRRSKYLMFILFAVMTAVGMWHAKQSNFIQGANFNLDFADEPLPIRLIAWLDPIRGAHWTILWQGIKEYWPTGLGLGGSHIALAEYSANFLAKGMTVAGDAPLNFYLGWILELGLGAALIIGFCLVYVRVCYKLIRTNAETRLASLAVLFFLVSFALSGLVGTQIIFRSMACLMAFCLSFILGPIFQSTLKASRLLSNCSKILIGGTLCFFFCSSALHYIKPPRMPEFFWAKQGKPQMPLSYNIPIATPGKSQWMPSGVPIAYNGLGLSFYVELPPEYYPQNISVAIFSSLTSALLFDIKLDPIQYDVAHPGGIINIPVDAFTSALCSRQFSPSDYCFAIIDAQPVWNVRDGVSIGYSFIEPVTF